MPCHSPTIGRACEREVVWPDTYCSHACAEDHASMILEKNRRIIKAGQP